MRELSLNVMDIAQNSISANARLIKISVTETEKDDTLTIIIKDDGKGMTPQQVQQVQDPFFTTRTTRSVGLGVPLFKMAAEQTGGSFAIQSILNVGTTVTAVFKPHHMDMTPLGDINSTISLLIQCNPTVDFIFYRQINDKNFELNTKDIKEIMGDIPLNNPDVMEWIKGYLSEQTQIINGGATNQ